MGIKDLLRPTARRVGRFAFRVARRLGGIPAVVDDTANPASFATWIGRSFKLRRPTLAIAPATVEAETPLIAVVLHVHFPDLVDDLVSRIGQIPVPFDLFVTNTSGSPIKIDRASLPEVRGLTVVDMHNRGRDILPLIRLVNDGFLDPYELVLKVHTKKSEWRAEHDRLEGTGEQWRDSFLDALLPSREGIAAILHAFSSDPLLGVMTAPGNVVGPEHWGGNAQTVHALLARIQVSSHELEFAAGSIYWARGFLLQGLRAFDLVEADFDLEAGQIDGTTAHAVERIIGIVTRIAGYETRTGDGGHLPEGDGWRRYLTREDLTPRARAIPFYLPQFHAFPENDRWWGKGFTEWSNVVGARPLFPGHVQPMSPGELGFYDLADPTVRPRQYALAKEAGIEGFMYYYYWFSGRTIMSSPIEAHHGAKGDEPFCIMWANENWTRTWDGGAKDILIGQEYERVPAEQFIDDVMHLLLDERYIRIDGCPVVAVYKIAQFPDPTATLAAWRQRAEEAGLPGLHLISVDVGGGMDGVDGAATGHEFDSYLEFPPHNLAWTGHDTASVPVDPRFAGRILRYESLVEDAVDRLVEEIPEDRFPGVMVGFDNTARRQYTPDLWYGSNPYSFRRWLAATVDAMATRDPSQRIVFINAWNEWAESAVLEPSQRFGRTYLLAVRDVLIR